MMARKIEKTVKIICEGGKASPAPPIGPALGAAGLNIMMFCKEYNARTADKVGQTVPAEISVYEDKSFTFVLKTPPTSELIKKAAGIDKGAGFPNAGKRGKKRLAKVFGAKMVAGEITMAQVEEIAKTKEPDFNTKNLEANMKTVMGQCRNMGVQVIG